MLSRMLLRANRLVWRSFVLGHSYSRRDIELLRRTAKDAFRLLPFASLIMTTGFTMTYLVWVRVFPFILPSHFRKAAAMIDSKHQQRIDLEEEERLEVAKELRHLTRYHVENSKTEQADRIRLLQLLDDVQDPHVTVHSRDILSVSKLFSTSLELDNLDRRLLVGMAKFYRLETFVPTSMLRFQLRRRIRSIQNDDRIISVEGIDSLSLEELQAACYKRGLTKSPTAVETPEILRRRLRSWMSLSLFSPDVPVAMLVFYSAFKMQHATLEDQELEPLEVRLRCLEEEREEMVLVKNSLEQKILDLNREIVNLGARLHEQRQNEVAENVPAFSLSQSDKRLEWAEQMLSKTEIAHIRRVFGKVASQHKTVTLDVDQAVTAVNMIKLRSNLILKEDVVDYIDHKYQSSRPVTITSNDFVVMYAQLSGRRWQPTWEERRRLALQHLEGVAARVEFENGNENETDSK
eukprot:c234_g1_i1.p1 GENE.c234_g1_i1~~c234_g1_i1.p1  ORF type:complete len:463 (+),score=82.64 c234_g1_i1:114-1502(+)